MSFTNISLTDIFLRVALLGAEWVMWLLVVLSAISVTVIAERASFFWRRRVDAARLATELTPLLRPGDVGDAQRVVQHSNAMECIVVAAGLAEVDRGVQAASEAMLSAKVRERLHLESRLMVLGTLGNNAPFIGLLGTVLGIIKASHELTAAQAAGQTAASAAMGGIFEALVATALGLFVAIPAVVAFNFFQRLVRTRSLQSDSLAHLVLSTCKPDETEPKTHRAQVAAEV
jgi:biopolymer transport protein ExbB